MKVANSIHNILSEDNSPTLFSEVFGESYRSAAGAVTESEYIFLRNALFRHLELRSSCPAARSTPIQIINILEYGFGTGLNALTTAAAADRGEFPENTVICYTSLDLYPLDEQRCSALQYEIDCPHGCDTLLSAIHTAPWCRVADKDPYNGQIKTSPELFSLPERQTEKTASRFYEILPNFLLRKIKVDFTEYNPLRDNIFHQWQTSIDTSDSHTKTHETSPWIDVVYFDPFSPECEPDCWSQQIFSRIAAAMRPNAVLSTYSAKGDVKRALRSAGLTVRRIPGTGRKRHNLIALRDDSLAEREQSK